MNRIWTFFSDTRVLTVIGLASLAAFLFLGAETLKIAVVWAGIALAAAIVLWVVGWAVRKFRAHRAARALEQAIDDQAAKGATTAPDGRRAEAVLRGRMQQAIKTIKHSKLGQLTGAGALYELPWYMVIGNPAAGKSTAIVKSGLTFPFAEQDAASGSGNIIQGIGGTRNCDWFFTSEGILLDTAGRYSVHEEDRGEWLGFLDLLKKHRPKAPINGIIIAASAAELAQGRPEQAIQLAKSLRQRVQELTERLEVVAPVYLVLTKADLIAGFTEFFDDSERSERERVWGATLPYEQGEGQSAPALFDARFDELAEGLRELSLARMSLARGQPLAPAVLAFPLEFAAVKPALRAFVATLFEENPYQFRPVFRGFYFTSAVQQGASTSLASAQIAQHFGLHAAGGEDGIGKAVSEAGFFLRDLFGKVVFADRNLVKQYASRRKLQWRAAALGVGVLTLAVALGGWSWAYLGNRQLMRSVQADLDYAVKLQAERSDLASRLEALELLQDRIVQLTKHRSAPPVGLSLGLYQGDEIERRLREEYFNGVRQVMLQPVVQTIEGYLGEVNAHPDRLKPMARTPGSGALSADSGTRRTLSGARFVDASPEDSAEAYNALKTYLMLADRERLEPNHLTDQITRFWRGWLDDNRGTMPREQMIRSAENLISFVTSNVGDPAFPLLSTQFALVDQTRENLREMVKGMRGIERVYANVKARAATRYGPITVAGLLADADKGTLTGSHAVSGPFTREAWDGYIEQAFKDAASNEMQSVDWVLKTRATDDITLEGSPEQIRKKLTDQYKTEYVAEWQRFMQGVAVGEFSSFDVAVERLNRLGDAQQSPIRKLLQKLFDQTSWDNPSLLNSRLATTQQGVLEWIKQRLLRMGPARVDVNLKLSADKALIPLGPIGREFAPLAQLMMTQDNSAPPVIEYLQSLAKVRTRFNQIKNQGDPGPGARALIAKTLEGGDSELTETLRYVDERMLVGMTDSAKAALRPLLVRPLIQAMTVAVPPAEIELNRIWVAQVGDPFQRTLASKFPFDAASRVEAGPSEIAKVFGPDGAVAKYAGETLGPLVVRRGDTVEARRWADIGIRLRSEFTQGFGVWVSPLEGSNAAAVAAGSGGAGAAGPSAGAAVADQTVFQVQPQGAPGFAEYTLVIDGQRLRYRNTAPEWMQMVWPNPSGVAGASLHGVTNEGHSVELVNEPGANGLTRLFESAQSRKLPDGNIELAWTKGAHRVALVLKVLRLPGEAPRTGVAPGGASSAVAVAGNRLRGVALPALVVGSDAPVQGASQIAAGPVSPSSASGAARPAPVRTAPAGAASAVSEPGSPRRP
ncbi:type VI secretion system membrane subunit TssM [Pseudorhodoferax sp. Leaf267]|uniref:type VI secretion system membrane subunit TssM n=1 Tax=Pseudorhodoferax sp. Leaf267 TaxID=1736316 RepID=UPI0006FA085B|nr:type VI secretion system membrane subunit TssM [Pseudorhodoferax sp. Leaf267]KQP12618.1 type VI secretion protein VasK [Pseudorhodoferax sp. Leaf267]